ncbi:MAG: hypothetical protein LBP95_01365 [Deltaproteobacteria bacterium]|jgi:hypothetical protein|nr:hypothetical protein [Deltaproteobacteria bacterium]
MKLPEPAGTPPPRGKPRWSARLPSDRVDEPGLSPRNLPRMSIRRTLKKLNIDLAGRPLKPAPDKTPNS